MNPFPGPPLCLDPEWMAAVDRAAEAAGRMRVRVGGSVGWNVTGGVGGAGRMRGFKDLVVVCHLGLLTGYCLWPS